MTLMLADLTRVTRYEMLPDVRLRCKFGLSVREILPAVRFLAVELDVAQPSACRPRRSAAAEEIRIDRVGRR